MCPVNTPLSAVERESLRSMTGDFRNRLGGLSWFMKCLNEPIAQRANAEDHCTEHFWEAKFHSQALLSDQALITAMVYVDLNPVRAGIARTPERAAYTSLGARLRTNAVRRKLLRCFEATADAGETMPLSIPVRPLMPYSPSIDDKRHARSADALPVTWPDYLALVDITGRLSSPGKPGKIGGCANPIRQRLGAAPARFF